MSVIRLARPHRLLPPQMSGRTLTSTIWAPAVGPLLPTAGECECSDTQTVFPLLPSLSCRLTWRTRGLLLPGSHFRPEKKSKLCLAQSSAPNLEPGQLPIVDLFALHLPHGPDRATYKFACPTVETFVRILPPTLRLLLFLQRGTPKANRIARHTQRNDCRFPTPRHGSASRPLDHPHFPKWSQWQSRQCRRYSVRLR